MNKTTRHLIAISQKVVRLQADLVQLKEKGVQVSFLARRVEEIQRLKDSVGLQ